MSPDEKTVQPESIESIDSDRYTFIRDSVIQLRDASEALSEVALMLGGTLRELNVLVSAEVSARRACGEDEDE